MSVDLLIPLEIWNDGQLHLKGGPVEGEESAVQTRKKTTQRRGEREELGDTSERAKRCGEKAEQAIPSSLTW